MARTGRRSSFLRRRNRNIVIGVVLIGAASGGYYAWWRSKNFTRNFTVKDFTRSTTAEQQGIAEQWNPPKEMVRNGRRFAQKVLQPVRNQLGVPIFVNSWWRHKKTNDAVGGVKDSKHMVGEAVDIRTVIQERFRNDKLAQAVLNSGVPFTKMILEKGTIRRPLWIHLRYTPGQNDQKIIAINDTVGTIFLTKQQIHDII